MGTVDLSQTARFLPMTWGYTYIRDCTATDFLDSRVSVFTRPV